VARRKLDVDVREMSEADAKQELMRLRALIRKHRKAEGNARCWLLDEELYEKGLPEGGRQNSPKLPPPPRRTFLKNCERYYDRQHTDARRS
jgi:hypothetical protein